jgi:hypothetical protein
MNRRYASAVNPWATAPGEDPNAAANPYGAHLVLWSIHLLTDSLFQANPPSGPYGTSPSSSPMYATGQTPYGQPTLAAGAPPGIYAFALLGLP